MLRTDSSAFLMALLAATLNDSLEVPTISIFLKLFGWNDVVKEVAARLMFPKSQLRFVGKIDYVGKNIPTQAGDRVELRGDDGDLEGPLRVVLRAEGEGGR